MSDSARSAECRYRFFKHGFSLSLQPPAIEKAAIPTSRCRLGQWRLLTRLINLGFCVTFRLRLNYPTFGSEESIRIKLRILDQLFTIAVQDFPTLRAISAALIRPRSRPSNLFNRELTRVVHWVYYSHKLNDGEAADFAAILFARWKT